MKQKILPFLFLALCGLVAWKFAESGQLKRQVAELNYQVDHLKANLDAEISKKIAVEKKAKEGGGGVVAASVSAPAGEAKKEEEKKDKNPMAALAVMMKDENTRKMMKDMSKGMIEGMYKDLFELLELDPEKKKAIMEILAEGQASQQELGMKLITDSSMSKEDKAALVKQLGEAHTAAEAKIKEALGDEKKFEQYKTYQDSAPERMQIGALKSKFESAGQPMSEELEQKVMNTMFTERKNMKFDHNYSNPNDTDMTKFSDEALASYEKQSAQYDENVVSKLSPILSPEQMEAFKAQRSQSRAMEKMGINMGKAMFGDTSK